MENMVKYESLKLTSYQFLLSQYGMVQTDTNGSCFQAGIEAILLRLLRGFLGFWFQFGGVGFLFRIIPRKTLSVCNYFLIGLSQVTSLKFIECEYAKWL